MLSARGWGRGIVNSCSMRTEFQFLQNEKSCEDGWWGWLPNTVKLLNATEVRVLVAQSCLTLWGPQGLYPSRLLLSMGFSRQKYWSELPFPSPEDLPDPGIKPASPKNVYNSVKQFLIGAYICFTIFVYIKKMFSTVCIFYIIFSLRKRF